VLENLPVAAAVFAVLAGLVHVYIFVLESLRWTAPATRRTFGTSEDEALATRSMAYNQGWYNLFLAVGAIGGAILALAADGSAAVAGSSILLFATGSMVAAALVLVTSDSTKLRAGSVQGFFPLVAIVLALLLG